MILKKIGFIGAGNMATAIINGLSAANNGALICVYDIDREKAAKLFGKATAVDSLEDLMHFADIVVFAVKPQSYGDMLTNLRPLAKPQQLFISIAAGITSEYVKQALGFDAKVVRVMPNTPALLGKGATALSHVAPVTDKEFETACDIFRSVGITEELPEDKMNEIIAVNGSSPAFIYLLAKAIIDGAVNMGIDPDTAKTLFCKTLEGSAAMIEKGEYAPDELIKMVSSPGGTTLAALEVLEQSGFYNSVIEAMDACTKRAVELAK